MFSDELAVLQAPIFDGLSIDFALDYLLLNLRTNPAMAN
jgi:hypothetical protein